MALSLLQGRKNANESKDALYHNGQTFQEHFEKAFSDVPGAYSMICQQFARNEAGGALYVNREEDMGVEGLRKSKESYRPAFMGEKGVLVPKAGPGA